MQNYLHNQNAKLGFGLMRLPEKDGAIDIAAVSQMVDACMDSGCTYFDTAYVYHGGESEKAVREALVARYARDSYQLASKMPAWEINEKKNAQSIFAEQLARTGAKYFDFYLLHSLDEDNVADYDKFGLWDWIAQKKQAGLVRHMGFSYHGGPDMLETLLNKHPEMEFVQLQINYIDWEDADIASRRNLEVARRHNKPVIVMEPVKGGMLAKLPEKLEAILQSAAPGRTPASWALRFAGAHEGVICVLSGMTTMEQMQDNIATYKKTLALNAKEQAALQQVVDGLNATPRVGCTSCRYCVDGCPARIDIPNLIEVYNHSLTYGISEGLRGNYEWRTEDSAKASACISCGACEGVCPQHLPIIKTMGAIAEQFEK